jgi:hypothetical protein
MQSRSVTRLTRGSDGSAVPDRRQNAGILAGVEARRGTLDYSRVIGGYDSNQIEH